VEEEMAWKVKAGDLKDTSAQTERKLKAALDELSGDRARLHRALETAGAELREARDQAQKSAASLQTETEARCRVASGLKQLELEAGQLRDQLARRAAECDQLRASLDETVSRGGSHAQLSSELTEARARLTAMAERLARTEEEAAKAKIEEATTKSKSEQLKREMQTLRETATAYKLEVQDCHARLAFRTTEAEGLQSEVRTLKTDTQQLQRSLDVRLKYSEAGDSQVHQLQQALHETEANLRQLEHQAREQEERQAALLREQDSLQSSNSEHSRLHEQSSAECRRLEGRVHSLERELDMVRQRGVEWESKYSDADLQRGRLESSARGLGVKASELERHLEAKQKEVVQMKTLFERLDTTRGHLESRLHHCNATIHGFNAERLSFQKDKELMESQLQVFLTAFVPAVLGISY
jgi:chromosome segregation ATPase